MQEVRTSSEFGLGFAALKEERFPDAITSYQSAVRLSPQNADAFYMLGVAFHYEGNLDEAKNAWRRYLELDPNGTQSRVVKQYL